MPRRLLKHMDATLERLPWALIRVLNAGDSGHKAPDMRSVLIATDGLFPRVFGIVSSRGTPARGLIISSALTTTSWSSRTPGAT